MSKRLTHRVLVLVPVDMLNVAIDRPARLRVAQHTRMVDERLRALIRGQVQLDEYALNIVQIPLERVQESARLKVLRRRASTRGNNTARPASAIHFARAE